MLSPKPSVGYREPFTEFHCSLPSLSLPPHIAKSTSNQHNYHAYLSLPSKPSLIMLLPLDLLHKTLHTFLSPSPSSPTQKKAETMPPKPNSLFTPILCNTVPDREYDPPCLSPTTSSALSSPPALPTLSEILHQLPKRQQQQPTPPSTTTTSSIAETLKENPITTSSSHDITTTSPLVPSPETLTALCETITQSFPFTHFATTHSIPEPHLRHFLNSQILLPILSSPAGALSPEIGPLHELHKRAETYRIVHSALAAHISTKELEEARELRQYEKMRAKEIWAARKLELTARIAELETESEEEGRDYEGLRKRRGGAGGTEKQGRVKGGKSKDGKGGKAQLGERKREVEREKLKRRFRIEKEERGREKVEGKEGWGRRRRRCVEEVGRRRVVLMEGV